jgi:hypothetical protein
MMIWRLVAVEIDTVVLYSFPVWCKGGNVGGLDLKKSSKRQPQRSRNFFW